MFSDVRQLHEWMQQLQTGYASSAEMCACSRGFAACRASESLGLRPLLTRSSPRDRGASSTKPLVAGVFYNPEGAHVQMRGEGRDKRPAHFFDQEGIGMRARIERSLHSLMPGMRRWSDPSSSAAAHKPGLRRSPEIYVCVCRRVCLCERVCPCLHAVPFKDLLQGQTDGVKVSRDFPERTCSVSDIILREFQRVRCCTNACNECTWRLAHAQCSSCLRSCLLAFL
jgi:hypothetical protein